MEILRVNHTRKPDSHTHRIQTYSDPKLTTDFKVLKSEIEGGLSFEAKCLGYTWTVTLSPQETNSVIESLPKRT